MKSNDKKEKFGMPSEACQKILDAGGHISLRDKVLRIRKPGLKLLSACDYVCKTYRLQLVVE
jgi:hypothetical protein